jgi:hypothetical protein
MNKPYVEQNSASGARLRAIVERLTEQDWSRPLGHGGWTVKVALAHLAFWDRRNLATLMEWERNGVQVRPLGPDSLNDDMLPHWLGMEPGEVAAEVLAAAEDIDAKIETLNTGLVEEILTKRARTLVRAIHRNEHLDEVERALAPST